jgi:hypothetical protein
MKVILDFVHRNDNLSDDDYHSHHSDDDDDDYDDYGPLQLIRPMPDKLRPYVTTEEYDDFCLQKIDPLLKVQYEIEESREQYQTYFRIIFMVLFGIAVFSLYVGIEEIFISIWSIGLAFSMIHWCVQCHYSGHDIEEEMHTECGKMSNRCTATSRNAIVVFELVMKRVWESANETGDHYTRKISHIVVTIFDKKHYDYGDEDSYHEYLPCC